VGIKEAGWIVMTDELVFLVLLQSLRRHNYTLFTTICYTC